MNCRASAERVQQAPIYLRYIRIPFQINCRASTERVQPGPIYWQYISTANPPSSSLLVDLEMWKGWLWNDILRFEMNKRRKYKWKLLVFVNCCCYFKQSFRICSAMHCDVLLLGYISNIYVGSEPPECTDILRYILSCRASAIYGLPINLRYIYKRFSSLLGTLRALTSWQGK